MPKIIRVTWTPDGLDELNARSRRSDRTPHERERLEMTRLPHLGFTIPPDRRPLSRHPRTARRVVSGFLTHGRASLPGRPP